MTYQKWTKLGQVYAPTTGSQWMASHASYPTSLCLDAETVRVFFSPRDSLNRSSITYLDLRLKDTSFEILFVGDRPLLTPGPRGTFDESGVSVSCAVVFEERVRLYYLGWNKSVEVPFKNFIGLAESGCDRMDFRRVSPAPIIDRAACDPLCLGYPWVLATENLWRIWYGSHLRWGPKGLEMIHVIKTGTSRDGVNWVRSGEIAVDILGLPEFAVSRPSVIKTSSGYRMWFAKRAPKYELGYAESRDGYRWVRHDEFVGLKPSDEDWDSNEVTYPCVFVHGGRTYMLYNGNGYGRTGFGIALLEE